MTNIAQLEMKPFNFGGAAEPDQAVAIAAEIGAGRIQHGVWESGPGEFELRFAWHETAYILEGRADVENLATREKFSLGPGSMISFEQGSHWRWRIPWKVKKVFTIVE